jgi:GNAT superfamily N-acetyltransferase
MEAKLGGNALSANANSAFLYRTLAATEALLLSGAAPKEQERILIACATEREWAQTALAMPYDGKTQMASVLQTAIECGKAAGRGTAALILPNIQEACADVREFCIVYDFVMEARDVSVLAKSVKAKPAPGVSVHAGAPPQLIAEASENLAEQGYGPARMWQGLAEAEQVKVHCAHIARKPVGLSLAIRSGLEYRLAALYTVPDMRGRGVGRTLAEHFLERAAKSNCPLITAAYPGGGTFEYYAARLGFAHALTYEVHFAPGEGFSTPSWQRV